MKEKIRLACGSGSCDVYIERGGIEKLGEWIKSIFTSKKIYLITDERIENLYGKKILHVLKEKGFKTHLISLDLRESLKNLDSVKIIYEKLLGMNIDRQSAIVALGGGVVGDITGYVAATILRGVKFFQIPTTLLAQIDASIGGKVGVNFQGVKNLIGCFYQPLAVFIDPDLLKTLDSREFLNGMAEMIKYGIIRDPDLFSKIEQVKGNWWEMDEDLIEDFIAISVKHKVEVVGQDEKEAGIRAHLNFGHTFGHALELEKDNISHGEAVALGMSFAAWFSVQKGICKEKEARRVTQILEKIPMPLSYDQVDFESVYQRMTQDKKKVGNHMNMVLMNKIGHVQLEEVCYEEIFNLYQKPELWWRKES